MPKAKSAQTNRSHKRLKEEVQVGWCELVHLPELGLGAVRAKMDSGAATSSIHATRISAFQKDGTDWAEFSFRAAKQHPAIMLRAPIVDRRIVRSSNGKEQLRYVIGAKMEMGGLQWEGQLTLANRGSMAFPILLGRRALRRGFLVNSGKRWLLGKPTASAQ